MEFYSMSEARARPDARAAARTPMAGKAKPPLKVTKDAWFVRAYGDGYLDARVTHLSDRAHRVFQVLNCRAAMDPFCFPGNEWVCQRTGKKDATLREIYAELEDSGWLLRVYSDESRKERIGFILLRRVDPDTPSAEATPEGIERARAAMFAAISGDRNAGFPASHDPGNSAARANVTPGIRRQGDPCRRISSDRDAGNPASHDAGNPAAYQECIVQEDSLTKTTIGDREKPSSSSSLPQPVENVPEDPNMTEAMARARKLWPGDEALGPKAKKACDDFGTAEFLKAIEAAEHHIRKEKVSVTWGYLLGILKNGRAEGGILTSPSISRVEVPEGHQPVERYPTFRESPEKKAIREAALALHRGVNP